MTVGVS